MNQSEQAINEKPAGRDTWRKRIGWLILLWACSVGALGVAAYLLRLLMHAVGLTA